jgi:hypothetical protein
VAIELVTFPVVDLANSNQAYALASSHIFVTSVTIQAEFNNTAKIALGGSSVTPSTGIEIPPGDTATIEIDKSQNSEIYIDEIYLTTSVAGQAARVTAFKRRTT